MALTTSEVSGRLAHLRERIRRAGGRPEDITIVAVTKGRPAECAAAALCAGLCDVGENYADELLEKRAAVASGLSESPGRWHFLGHIQRRKVRGLAGAVHLWQGVDRLAAGEEIARRSPGAMVLVQVNVSAEPQKNGCRPEDAAEIVEGLRAVGLDVRGLMAVGRTGPAEAARAGFRRLAQTADRLGLEERSMGMSGDLEVAVQEGSTMVRIGRALFDTGARAVPR